MRNLNEYVARKANKEDKCTGRFWEARFKSQALLDEAAIVSCMAYVDLNPIRAAIAKNLKTSDLTSIQARINAIGPHTKSKPAPTPKLMSFIENERDNDHSQTALPFNLKDYIELVDWTGRAIRDDKRDFISTTEPKILDTLGLTTEDWQILTTEIQRQSIVMFSGLERIQHPATRKRQASG